MPDSRLIWINESQLATLLEDYPATITFDKNSIASAELNYSCLWEYAPDLVAGLTQHPDFTWLKRKSARIEREEAELARVSIQFEGVNASASSAAGEPEYSLEGAVSSEPIESHPNFGAFAGDVVTPNTANGATFQTSGDDYGKFLGFVYLLANGDVNPKAGVKSYLEPSLIYTETRTLTHVSDTELQISMEKLGKIDTPPSSDCLPVISGRDWLLIECNAQQVGEGVRVVKKWRMSGRNGWDTALYTDLP